jgi:hypothetical protein
MPHEMTPDEIREFLSHGTRTAKLATTMANGAPHADKAEEFGRRNVVPGELVVRLRPERVIAQANVAGY